MGKRKTHEEYVEELARKNPNIEVLEKYKGANVAILHRCKIDGYTWPARPGNILFGKGCPKCAGILKLTNDEYVERLKIVNPYIVPIEEYINAKTHILHMCLIDGYIWRTTPSATLQGYGCPECAGNTKKTHEEYINELATCNPNIEPVEKYIDAKTPILHRCLIHDLFWYVAPTRALSGANCSECKKENLRKYRLKTHDQYVEEIKVANPNVKVASTYIDSRTPIKHYCVKHNIYWDACPDSILRGAGCPECCKEKIGEKNGKTHEQYIIEVSKVNPDIEVIGTYIDSKTAILHRCKKHDVQWYAYPTNILRGHGCPQCNESNGEKRIRHWLDSNGIEYIPQKIFDDCKNRRALPFDFYIPSYNLCIEYDGEQHFRSVDYFGGEDGFQQRQHNDEIKTQYCESHNIHLLRIPYYKNIEDELDNFYLFNIVTSMVI